jgi:hypothetical protein
VIGYKCIKLSTLFSAMQNEFGEYPGEVTENDGSGGGSVVVGNKSNEKENSS